MLEFVSFVAKEGVYAPCVRGIKAIRLWAFYSKMMTFLLLAGLFSSPTAEQVQSE